VVEGRDADLLAGDPINQAGCFELRLRRTFRSTWMRKSLLAGSSFTFDEA
jgi:hypothetical protein